MKRANVMRKPILLAAAIATGLLLATPVAAQAQPEPFTASFKGIQKLNDPPCAGGATFCGSGSVTGYGAATYSGFPIALGPLEGSCQPLTAIALIELSDGTGSLTALADGSLCFPGKSRNAPGGLVSWGNPFRIDAAYDIASGEGVFAGADGAGTATLRGAGAQNQLEISGTLGP